MVDMDLFYCCNYNDDVRVYCTVYIIRVRVSYAHSLTRRLFLPTYYLHTYKT